MGMYIQITTRCQMRCAHCCWSCTNVGDDIQMDPFVAAIKLAAALNSPVTLGGGEPTLHPRFWEMADYATQVLPSGTVGVITNGADKREAFQLLEWHLQGKLEAELSQDMFHAAISPAVVEAFTQHGLLHEGDKDIINHGRAKDNGIGFVSATGEPDCICENIFLEPNGELFSCGCRIVSFGTSSQEWQNRVEKHFELDPYSCAAVSRWKAQQFKALKSKFKNRRGK